MPTHLSQLVRFFVERVSGAGRTAIVKLLYMADHESRRFLGKPISDLRYRWDQFGPFDPRILDELDQLRDQGFVEEDRVLFYDGNQGYRYKSTSRHVSFDFNDEQSAILNYVAVQFGCMPLRELLEDVVYETEPMRDAKKRDAFGKPLNMQLVDNQARVPGLELDRVLRSVSQLDQGLGRPLREVMDELRSNHLPISG